MQDKNLQAQQETLADMGWQRMAVLLDVEMPVSGGKRRRGALWMWCTLTAGVAIVAASFFFRYQQRPGELQQPLKTPAPSEVPAMASIPEQYPVESDPAIPQIAATPPAASMQASAVSSLRHVPAGRYAPLFAGLPAVLGHEKDVLENSTTMNDAWLAPPALLPALDSRLPAHFSATPLPGLPLAAIDCRTTTDLHWEKNPAKPLRKKVRWGAEAAVGVSPSAGVNTLAAGPVMEYKTGRRFALRGGLQVSTASYTLSSSGGGARSSNDPGPGVNFDNTAIGVVASSVRDGYNWTFRANSLQVPLTASLAALPRLWIETGITPSYIWTTQNASVDAAFESVQPPVQNAFSTQDLGRAVSNSTERFELLLAAGVRYLVSPQFSVGLHYQVGLNDLQPLQTVQARQQNLRISGMMYF